MPGIDELVLVLGMSRSRNCLSFNRTGFVLCRCMASSSADFDSVHCMHIFDEIFYLQSVNYALSQVQKILIDAERRQNIAAIFNAL